VRDRNERSTGGARIPFARAVRRLLAHGVPLELMVGLVARKNPRLVLQTGR